MPGRVFISDLRPLFGGRLATALGRDGRFDVVEWTGAGPTLFEHLARWDADILVLGADVLDMELVGRVREIAALSPELSILVLGGSAVGDEQVVECLLAGAGGFLFGEPSPAEVSAAIEVVARGERVCPPGVMRLLFARLGALGQERKRRERLEVLELSAREAEILRLVADRLTNQQIARRLHLSVHTVKNHVHRILESLGVDSRWRAVDHAVAKGWLQDRRPGS